MSFKVLYDENGAFMDEEARSTHGIFATPEEAIAACRRIVDADLEEVAGAGDTPTSILSSWQAWWRDPFIVALDTEPAPPFSAWTYAEEHCHLVARPQRLDD